MNKWQKDVHKFHEKFSCEIGNKPGFADEKTMKLRMSLIKEEIDELECACNENDFPGLIDAFTDTIYVLLGTAVSVGVDLEPIWNEVQKTNMAKIPGNSRKDGKVLKPDDWSPPDIDLLLSKQGWENDD